MKENVVAIYGKHAVLEALEKRPDTVQKLYIRNDITLDADETKLVKQARSLENFSGDRVPLEVRKDAVHQGFVASIALHTLLIPFATFRSTLAGTRDTALVVLGEIEDPHNVGAIIRSAAAFGAAAVLIPEHRSCPITGTVIKVSVGSAFVIPLVSVGNVNDALRKLQTDGFWVYGLDGDGSVALPDEQFTKPSVFVVGNESRGMRLKTHELCDTVLTIPIAETVESLNASVSAATVLYAWKTQQRARY